MEKIFAYGTLKNKDVQENIFGRILKGTPEIIVGYVLKEIHIEEEFGLTQYPIIMETQNPEDHINGMVYELTFEEVMKADTYEGLHYKRIQVKLQSDEMAWAYSTLT